MNRRWRVVGAVLWSCLALAPSARAEEAETPSAAAATPAPIEPAPPSAGAMSPAAEVLSVPPAPVVTAAPAAQPTVRVSAPSRFVDQAPDYTRVRDWLLLAAGAATGFVAHELGHLTFDLVVGSDPEFRKVTLGPIPFFAIAPQHPGSNNQLYTTAAMGFLVEAAYTEAIFARNPELIRRHRPFLEGMLAFHAALDLGYAITAFAGVGPQESDANTLARTAHIPRWCVGMMLAAPIALDLLRYLRPDTRRWSMWVGLGSRLPLFGAALVI